MSTPPFLDLPAGTRAYRLRTARGEFAVHDTAPAPQVPQMETVLLVPGFTGSKEDFIAILAELAARGHRAVAIDQRGQYESAGPEDETAYTLDELGADLLEVIDTLGDGPVHLVGHSFGGLVSRAAVLARPVAARSLTLLCSGPAAIPGAGAERARLMLQALGEYDLPTLWEAMQVFNAAGGAKPPEDAAIAEFLRRRFVANNPVCLRTIARHLLEEQDRVDALAVVGVPLLVAFGVNDDAWPPVVQVDMATRLGARHAVIAGAGHSPAVDQPELTVATLAAFWADQS